jgi:2-methylcitrate dehydratase PrpD
VTLGRRLAAEVAALRTAPLPPPLLARAHDLLIDHLGVALGGIGEDSSVAIRAGLATLGLRGDATVLGTDIRLPAPQAALANGAAAHALEMDDTHRGGSIHLGASVFPAALAAAELIAASGETVLRAAIAGYEVAARLAMAVGPAAHYRRGFHPTGTCGAFGAAAAAGLVLGLDEAQLADALGIAGSQAAGSMEFLADGAWTKRLHPGWAACAGLHAAAFARAGFRAPATIVEGRFGFLAGYSDASDPTAVSAEGPPALLDTSIKPHACCRYMQGPIDAVLALRATHGIAPADVEGIEVGMLAAAFPIVCDPADAKRRPTSVVDAQFSLPFGVAVALARGRAAPEEFALPLLDDPVVRDLMDRVSAVRDAALDAVYPRTWPAWVRLALRDGRRLEAHVTHPRGDPENFPTRDELAEKFMTLAARALPSAQCASVLAAAEALGKAPRIAELLAATTTPSSR